MESNEREIDGFTNVRGGVRQSSLNAVLDGKHKQGKKKPGILKGIGSMFRFGKHRKTDSGSGLEHLSEPIEFEQESLEPKENVQVNKEPEKTQEERIPEPPYQSRSQEHYQQRNEQQQHPQQLQQYQQRTEQQQQYQQRQEHQYQQRQEQYQPRNDQYHRQRQRMDHHHHNMIPENSIAAAAPKYHRDNENNIGPSRSERVHNLRSQHQQRHAERQGHYPNDEREEHYEEVIRQVSFS